MCFAFSCRGGVLAFGVVWVGLRVGWFISSLFVVVLRLRLISVGSCVLRIVVVRVWR